MSSENNTVSARDNNPANVFILTVLSIGHGITHYYMSAFLFLIPYIQASLGLSSIQVELFHFVRQVSGGVVTMTAGFIIDRFNNRWGLILTGCLILAAIVFGALGVSKSYVYLLLLAAVMPLPGQIWHIPAIVTISQRFPNNRGFGLSVHGIGAQVGSTAGPYITGLLMVSLFTGLAWEPWRATTVAYVIPTLIIAFFVWLALGNLSSVSRNQEVVDLLTRVKNAKALLKDRVIMILVLVIFLRNTGFNSLMVWVPLYLTDSNVYEDSLGYGPALAGFYFSLLTLAGAFSSPVLGWLSDRYSRKKVLIPSLIIASILVGLIPFVGGDSKLMLGIIFALTGLFTYSLGQLLQAAVLDQIGTGSEGATMGLVLGANSIISAFSPFIAGRLIVANFGISNVFFYNMALWVLAVVLLLVVKLRVPDKNL